MEIQIREGSHFGSLKQDRYYLDYILFKKKTKPETDDLVIVCLDWYNANKQLEIPMAVARQATWY